MCVCVYVCVYICVCVCLFVCVWSHMCLCESYCVSVCVRGRGMRASVCAFMHAYLHLQASVYVFVFGCRSPVMWFYDKGVCMEEWL